jgi:hypothetical protein
MKRRGPFTMLRRVDTMKFRPGFLLLWGLSAGIVLRQSLLVPIHPRTELQPVNEMSEFYKV